MKSSLLSQRPAPYTHLHLTTFCWQIFSEEVVSVHTGICMCMTCPICVFCNTTTVRILSQFP